MLHHRWTIDEYIVLLDVAPDLYKSLDMPASDWDALLQAFNTKLREGPMKGNKRTVPGLKTAMAALVKCYRLAEAYPTGANQPLWDPEDEFAKAERQKYTAEVAFFSKYTEAMHTAMIGIMARAKDESPQVSVCNGWGGVRVRHSCILHCCVRTAQALSSAGHLRAHLCVNRLCGVVPALQHVRAVGLVNAVGGAAAASAGGSGGSSGDKEPLPGATGAPPPIWGRATHCARCGA
jgi:hypothetical protein